MSIVLWEQPISIPLQVQEDQYFPADLLFLTSPNTDGVCYVEVFYAGPPFLQH